jgi:hypothetical protein
MRALLAVLAVILVAFFVVRYAADDDAADAAGGGTGSGSGGRPGAKCTIFADAPVVDEAGTVTATARYRCGKANGGVDATLYLQVNSGSKGWTNLDRQPVAATGSATTRDHPERARTVRASAACTQGSYRTFVRGTVSNGDRAYEVEAISEPVTLACPGPSPT